MKILFICTGNTCRSSMAEALAKKMVAEASCKHEYIISSAGIAAFPGLPASMQAITVMQEYDIDLSEHKARQYNREMIREADLVLTMTGEHRESIHRALPEYKDKVFTINEFANNGYKDIRDPFGQPVTVYQQVAVEIKEALRRVLKRVQKNKQI